MLALTKRLSYAGNEAARGYLDGRMDAARAADWLVRYAMNTPAQAAQRVKFFDAYRSYVINYNLGEDLVKAYVERQAGRRRGGPVAGLRRAAVVAAAAVGLGTRRRERSESCQPLTTLRPHGVRAKRHCS